MTEQGTGTSKGVGYVSFAIKEDATRALESIDKDGLELLGRKLRVQLAEKKVWLYFGCVLAPFSLHALSAEKGT